MNVIACLLVDQFQTTASDLLGEDKAGEKPCRILIEELLVKRRTSFHAPTKTPNLKSFSSTAKSSAFKGQEKKTKQNTAEGNVSDLLVFLAVGHNIGL